MLRSDGAFSRVYLSDGQATALFIVFTVGWLTLGLLMSSRNVPPKRRRIVYAAWFAVWFTALPFTRGSVI
jgi:hypothetical protein